jgi:hypothetical protein
MNLQTVVFTLISILLWTGCSKKEQSENIPTAKDYIGRYSGDLTRERMASNGWITKNAFVYRIPTEVEISQSDKGENFLKIYVSAYKDSILCEFDELTGYIWIIDKPYSFYLRTYDFPDFKGFYDEAVSTYGHLGKREIDNKIILWIGFLKNMNDSIYICNVGTIKMN